MGGRVAVPGIVVGLKELINSSEHLLDLGDLVTETRRMGILLLRRFG